MVVCFFLSFVFFSTVHLGTCIRKSLGVYSCTLRPALHLFPWSGYDIFLPLPYLTQIFVPWTDYVSPLVGADVETLRGSFFLYTFIFSPVWNFNFILFLSQQTILFCYSFNITRIAPTSSFYLNFFLNNCNDTKLTWSSIIVHGLDRTPAGNGGGMGVGGLMGWCLWVRVSSFSNLITQINIFNIYLRIICDCNAAYSYQFLLCPFIIQGDPKKFVPIFYLIKKSFFNEYLFCCRTWKVNLWMVVCSYSCPKNVLDNSAEDILPGGLFWDTRKFSSFWGTLQNHSHIVTRFSFSASVSFCFIGSCMGIGAKN
jgi:hypothetical protein